MKIICKKNTAEGLDLSEVTTILSNEVEHGLTIGQEYIVMGLMVDTYSNCMYYLIDEDSYVSSFPYMLFTITDHRLPSNWSIINPGRNNPEGSISTLIGFNELCTNEDFYCSLFDQEKEALEIYFKHKSEIQKKYDEEALFGMQFEL